MIALSRCRWLAAAGALFGVALLMTSDVFSQQKKDAKKKNDGPSMQTAEEFLKPKPRPKKDAIPASKLPLEFVKGERIAFVGNTTAERMSLYGHFETLLHLRHKDKELVVRNFGFPADEVGVRQRSSDYTKLDDPLFAFNPDTFLCFFGWNESFKGPAGVAKFQADYEKFINDYTAKYPRDDAKSPARFVLVSPIAFENTGDKFLPDGKAENANLKLYADAVKAVAEKRNLAFVDIYTPTLAAFEKGGGKLTVSGFQMNEAGDKVLGEALDAGLFGPNNSAVKAGTSEFEKIRAAVIEKGWIHSQDYRMVNGWYVYGGRRTYDTETFPREYVKLRNMVTVRDHYIWDIAGGKAVPEKPDDSKTGELIVPPTRFGGPDRAYSENPPAMGPVIAPPAELIKGARVPAGFKLELFADEKMFPELASPVQINFDSKGRLWVACMPTYPQWRPGDVMPNDRLLILEDKDGDGKADKCTVFYDKLHCPGGFEFYNGGVLVISQPRMLFLKDTDGDDKADEVTYLIDGWATDDTHHTCNAFEWSHGGLLHMLEGISTSTTLETPWGPHRSKGDGGCYVLDPRSMKVRQFKLPGMYNMWCYVFDEWGNGIVGDGTTANQTWDVPLSGQPYDGRKGVNFILPNGERPNLGNEWLVSRALPDDVQRQFTYACVINLNGLTRYTMRDDGAGFMGERIKPKDPKDGKWDDLVRSPNKHFRPGDPQIGPDGRLYFVDWASPLIGHMQYSQRDPNRNHTKGRVYRMVGADKQPIAPVTQQGKSVAEILEQLREYEWRTRYRARRELHDRPAAEVLPAVAKWAAELKDTDPDFDRLRCEALWAQQSHHAVDAKLADAVLACKTFNARAAVVHILADERDRIPGAVERFKKAAGDESPRVRAEAARALSFFATADAMNAVASIAQKPLDYWTKYTVEAALSANVSAWPADFTLGKLAASNPEAAKLITDIQKSSKAGEGALPHLKVLLSLDPQPKEVRNKAMTALAGMTGNPTKGREVFVRACTACHKVGNGEGNDYGPNLDKVATKSKFKQKVIESIIDPNAEVDAKYLSTKIDRLSGGTVTGLIVSEDKKNVVIFDGKEKKTIPVDDIDTRTTLKQSSMPEGQAGTMAPVEFLDLVEYLWSLK
ncbi:PVC-type heme-binding CxxCH protein [Limnoglobus roseus]|uniref:Putative beta-propeller-type glycoside hydrolase and putative carbohydrate esterase n=1 Tax=Limnoglobus roseus TaxID=2598579 RepID=A0A5C1APD3_9BACT|nr:PVC-type heme-binding CxxCH protein [Limnoglobus roseus]QEL20860.1 putative beta-propeller-type glycoside hydrolase and putative carbohydrate esterase [Limnoglobus roseus]